jgi:hypothetical protein
LIKKATTLTKITPTKVSPLWNPQYKKFMEKCGGLYGETSKRKSLKNN